MFHGIYSVEMPKYVAVRHGRQSIEGGTADWFIGESFELHLFLGDPIGAGFDKALYAASERAEHVAGATAIVRQYRAIKFGAEYPFTGEFLADMPDGRRLTGLANCIRFDGCATAERLFLSFRTLPPPPAELPPPPPRPLR